MPPALYIVSTPIGNLEDITLRALRILKEVDLIAAEDTRHTAVLLDRYDIRTPTTSFHEHNEREKTPALLSRLAHGETIALVSDAGTPGISDPGYRLVGAARSAGIQVVPVPGPSAVLAALVSSGFPTDSFLFLGFPPRKQQARRRVGFPVALERREPSSSSNHRIACSQTLEDLQQYLVERPIMCRQRAHQAHEELVIRPINEFLKLAKTPRGEYVLMVSPVTRPEQRVRNPIRSTNCRVPIESHQKLVFRPNATGSVSAAEHFRLPSRTVYAAVERRRNGESCRELDPCRASLLP